MPDGGAAASAVPRRDWTALLALALVLRLVAAWQESVLHPDEVFQYLEGAFRLLHGYSVVTWEYRDGMRGDLYPALLALPMRLGEWIAPDGSLTIWLPRTMMAILSLSIVAAAGVIGARVSRLHFWAAGLIAACWPDLVAFAPHPLTEQMAALLAAPAIALLGLPGRSARQLTVIGAAVGLAVVFRPHVAPALALGCEMVIAGRDGTRTVGADDFFVDLFETAVGEDEILTAVRVPKHTGWGAHYEKFVRVAHQWPIVAVAAAVRVEGGTIAEARVGLTNMGSTPLRARAVEDALRGQPATEDAVREAASRATEGTNPPSDLNGDSDYRSHLATVLTRRAVLAAAGG